MYVPIARKWNTQARIKENKHERAVRIRESLSTDEKLLNATRADKQWRKSDIQTNTKHKLKIS